MKTNGELRADVVKAIGWDPSLKQTKIAVVANNGIVMLSGTVDSYVKKSQAENTVKKITGVQAVVEKIVVKFDNDDGKDDSEIAVIVLNALKSNHNIPSDKIQVEVEDGHVTLDGTVEWNYQKETVLKAVANVDGIKVLTNNIKIRTDNPDDIEKSEIEQAIARNWAMNGQDVQVYVSSNEVTLNGIVHSFYQKEEAERMAWNAPGVWAVSNELVIDYNE